MQTAVRGALSGTVVVHATKLKGANAYRIQKTDADPSIEANWRDCEPAYSCYKIVIAGLTPGRSYWVRMCGIGRDGAGVWAGPLSVMVV